MNDYTIEVEAVSGGWILEWHKKMADRQSYYGITGLPTSGKEIFTSKTKLMKRIEDLICPR